MDTRASLVIDEFGPTGLLDSMQGEDVSLRGIAALEDCGQGDLVFVQIPTPLATRGQQQRDLQRAD